ncbi:MAG: Malonate decarboxylase gamma subunit [uncultured Caballeronia sp.]|nr:MAG: Malonate decarboxylase gamma subunit [uncultured Caballeronia sp.]
MSANLSRGECWLDALTFPARQTESGPIRARESDLDGECASFFAVVPDPGNRFPRATDNVVGLEQGWLLARAVRRVIDADRDADVKRPIVAEVDESQAYGRREELLGIHLACAAAVDAYASAQLSGHPVIALIVGPAMSGAYLAHGYQANRIIALDAPGTAVHAMGKEAAARVTRRSIENLDALGDTVLPMSYKMSAYAKLGLLHELIEGVDADAPSPADIDRVKASFAAAVTDARNGPRDLSNRLASRRRETHARRVDRSAPAHARAMERVMKHAPRPHDLLRLAPRHPGLLPMRPTGSRRRSCARTRSRTRLLARVRAAVRVASIIDAYGLDGAPPEAPVAANVPFR